MFQRRFRRISSLLMALLLCLSATVPALAEGGCAHADAYKIQGDVVDYVPDATSPVQHKVITVTYEYTYCPTCGEKFSGKPLNETTTTTYESHSFTNGVCDLCHWTCTHKINSDRICEYCQLPCPHEWEYPYTDFYGHRARCKICGTSYYSDHTYENDICKYCGHSRYYADGCLDSYSAGHTVSCKDTTVCLKTGAKFARGEHYQTHHGDTLDDEYATSVRKFREWHDVYCTVCDGNIIVDSHNLENGVCTVCGYDGHLSDGCEQNHLVSCANQTICLKTGEQIPANEQHMLTVHHGATADDNFTMLCQSVGDEHCTVCSVCGAKDDWSEHNFENGKCTECGTTTYADGCEGRHTVLCETTTVCAISGQPVQQGELVYIHHGSSIDDYATWDSAESIPIGNSDFHVELYYCPLCNMRSYEGERCYHRVTCTNLTCSECGYTVSADSEAIKHADTDYLYDGEKHWKVCPDCGAKYDEDFHDEGTYYKGSGVCLQCDVSFDTSKCRHVIPCDGDSVCQRCGETVSPEDANVEVRHALVGGKNIYVPLENGYHGSVCTSCGEIVEKEYHNEYDFDELQNIISHIDANGHGFRCACGVFWYEPHLMINGECLNCGYTGEAGHKLNHMEGAFEADDSGHWRTCAYCDEKVSQEHTYKNDVCSICGYVKGSVTPTPIPTATPTPVPTATPTAEPTAVPTAEPTAVPTAEPTAVPTAEPTAVPTAEPTAVPTAVPTAEPTAEPTAKPTAKPTSAPVVTPTPVPMPTVEPLDPVIDYEDVEETEAVHGVVATEPQRIATTLVTAIEQIELENVGKETSIEIRNVEKVITETEKVVFDTLPAKEQVLVLLSSIGYETEVASALSSMDMTLSEDAVALTTSIQERLANASEEEKAAFEQMLTDSFPVETITIDGVEYEYFVIELVVDIDGDVHVERYGFRFDENGEWIFSRLSIGTIVE